MVAYGVRMNETPGNAEMTVARRLLCLAATFLICLFAPFWV